MWSGALVYSAPRLRKLADTDCIPSFSSPWFPLGSVSEKETGRIVSHFSVFSARSPSTCCEALFQNPIS